jgi:transposase
LTRIADLERLLDELATTTEQRERAYACLKEELLNLKRMMFGPRRERLPEAPGQGHLFDEEKAPNPPPEPIDDAHDDNLPKRRQGHGRRPIPEHLPRTDVPHDVPAADQKCACGRIKAKIGEDVTEQLDYVPGKLVVLRHIYPKYACPCCQDGVTTAPTAPAPIPGGLPTAGLLGAILVNKFTMHIPLYRQQDELARAGIFFPRSTLCDWVAQCGELLKPLADLMHEEVLKSRIIQGDETPVPVLDRSRDSTKKGYIWTTIGDRDHPYTTCHYTDSRSRDGPAEFLAGFQGLLQTDAYSSYAEVRRQGPCRRLLGARAPRLLRRAAELPARGALRPRPDRAVVRRRGRDRRPRRCGAPGRASGAKRTGACAAGDVLARAEGDGVAAEQVRPGDRLRAEPLGALLRYTADGALEIDNNRSERTLRPVAIGRKNWMFFGSDRGGETAAICMGVLANAKRHGIEPVAYVTALLTALSSEPVDLRSLLPDVWIAAHPEHFQKDRRDEAEAAAHRRRQRRADRRAKARFEAQAEASLPSDP